MKTSFQRLILLLIAILVSGCVPEAPKPAVRSWEYADLRALDTADSSNPGTDLVAVYTRTAGSDFEIRLDVLDLPANPAPLPFDLYIALDTQPGGLKHVFLNSIPLAATSINKLTPTQFDWDVVLVLPAGSPPAAYAYNTFSSLKNLQPRVSFDPLMDTVTVSLNRSHLPGNLSLEVFITLPGENQPIDHIGPVRTDGSPPARAPFAMVFWNTFPAATPAQAFRRWDGAHTGPRGERHGLAHLLEAARRTRIPVFLLDLKIPESLSALDFMGKMAAVQRLMDDRLVVLPDVIYSSPPEISLDFSRQVSQAFNLPASQFVYLKTGEPVQRYRIGFAQIPNESSLSRWQGMVIVPLPLSVQTDQATSQGPALETRLALLGAALSPELEDLVILGGDLTSTTWGSPDMVLPTFAYLAAHPWMMPLTEESLLTFPVIQTAVQLPLTAPEPSIPLYASSGRLLELDSNQLRSRLVNELMNAPRGPILDLAWQMLFTLHSRSGDESLHMLSAQYLGQIKLLLEANRWVQAPSPVASCDQDLDHDGDIECILASNSFFAVIEPDGARITFAFILKEGIPHQIIGPTSQFFVGFSDPSRWQVDRGPAGDPGILAGAFVDQDDPWRPYWTSVNKDGDIVCEAQDGSMIKTFKLEDNVLRVVYQIQNPSVTQVPVVISPMDRFRPAWGSRYIFLPSEQGWIWTLMQGPGIEVRFPGQASFRPFNASIKFANIPEDPNLDYPPGHYIPFPVGIGEISLAESALIELFWK